MFNHNEPEVWYFMSKQINALKRKNKSKLTIDNIKKSFLKNVGNSGIVAYFFFKRNNFKKEGAAEIVFEYFNKSEFGNI